MAVHFKGEYNLTFCKIATIYSEYTEDWNNVTCKSCLRSKKALIEKEKVDERFCTHNSERHAHPKRQDWKK